MDSPDQLISLLERCTARLSTPSTNGTGFFVAFGLILTCAHVVGDSQNNQTTVTVEWGDQTYHAKILRLLPSYPDLALLKLEDAPATHPCVLLHEAVQDDDKLRSYGYSEKYSHGDPASFVFEGKTGGPEKLLKFKEGEAVFGFSGAPLLNRRTGCVCGVLSITRGQYTLLGGRGIPISVVLERFEELVTLQKEFHDKDRQWYDLLPESEVKQFSWQELRVICSDITEKRMLSTVRYKYSEELYLQREHAHQAFMQFLEDPTKRGFVLVGGSGVGKSNFLLAAREELQSREGVCMLMYDAGSLMEYPLMEAINEDFHEQVGWTTQRLWEKIKSIDGIDKRLVLFCIDALNEHEQPRPLLKQLNELIQRPWPWLKVVIVSRPEAWQSIKRGVKPAEALYYRGEGEAPGAILESFNYSERLEPFSRQELQEVYARYERVYNVQTPYEDLSSRLRDIISDPFSLWLITRASKNKAIPANLKATTLIDMYVNALTGEGKLQGGDPDWLENQLIPLMISEGHYERFITSEELRVADRALHKALLDRADSSEPPQLQSFTNLADAAILKRELYGIGFTITFKNERFYDYFVGRRLFEMSEAQADQYTYFLDMIGRTTEHPYLWGAVRNALVQEAEQPDIEIVLRLCRTPDQHVREMMVSVLTTLGADALQQVERILKELVPAARRVTVIKKVRQWQGKATIDAGRPTRNAGRIATEVASNLNIPWLLQTAALQADSTIRTEAVRFAYHLWKRDHQAGFAILEHLTREITSDLIPEKAALESTIGLSMSIFFDSYQDEQVLRRLQGFWHDIVARMLAGEHGKLWERILRHLFFPPGRIFSTVINLVVGYIDKLPDYGEAFNYRKLEAFFHLEPDADERALYTRLVSYIDVEGNYSREQMERDFLAVMTQDNYLIVFMVQLGLIAHACQDPLAFLPFLQRFYEEAKKDVVAYPYMNDVIHVLDNVLHRGPMDDALFNFFVFTVEECQEFYIRHPEAIRNSNYKTKPEVHDLGPYIFHVYRKTGSVKTAWLETRIQSALRRNDTRFFELLLLSELSLIGIERQSPKAALSTVAMFAQQGNAAIRSKTQEFLAHLRAYYPNEVDDFLEEQDADNDFRAQVQIHEPEEDIATLIGQRSLYFLRDDIIMQSPTLRSRMLYLLAKAADCRNIRVWLDYFLRELINLLYGGEILHLPE